MREFKGRVIVPGICSGKVLATKTGFNILAGYNSYLSGTIDTCICSDINNKELFGKPLEGKILCMLQTIGSTSTGFVLQSLAVRDVHPKAMLIARKADSLVLAGVILAEIWEGKSIITIDQLGDEFINTVKNEDTVEITADGTVRIL